MKIKHFYGILAALLGLIIGVILGGYIGLIIGGTFLGGFNIKESIGLEGYELTFYIGAVIGALLMSIYGYKLGLKHKKEG